MKTNHQPLEMMDMVNVGDRFHRGDDEFARVYKFVERPGRSEDNEPSIVLECSLFGAFPDIYEGLQIFAGQTDARAVGLAITTCGWAIPYEAGTSPAEGDTPPSEHPDRRRVSVLFVLTDDNRQASRMVMTSTGEVLEENENDGQGQLVEACAMALHFHRADKEHLLELIETTRHRLSEAMTLEDFGFADPLEDD